MMRSSVSSKSLAMDLHVRSGRPCKESRDAKRAAYTYRVDSSSRFSTPHARRRDDRVVIPDSAQGNDAVEIAMLVFILVRFFREHRTYRSVVHELSTYTDRELNDLGIARADIRDIARLAAREGRPEA
jgi:uncharacterized protein YjiS (DUF1127 family)